MNLSIIIKFDLIRLHFWNNFDSQSRKEEEATAQLQDTISARFSSDHFAYLVLPKQKNKRW